MINSEIKIGKRYVAKVGGNITIIRITNYAIRGWIGKSCSTGRNIIIRSGQRLRRVVDKEEYAKWYSQLVYARYSGKKDPEIK